MSFAPALAVLHDNQIWNEPAYNEIVNLLKPYPSTRRNVVIHMAIIEFRTAMILAMAEINGEDSDNESIESYNSMCSEVPLMSEHQQMIARERQAAIDRIVSLKSLYTMLLSRLKEDDIMSVPSVASVVEGIRWDRMHLYDRF
jgi:hypothetical protein